MAKSQEDWGAELRDGFAAIVTRATEASGKDYGTLVRMAELK